MQVKCLPGMAVRSSQGRTGGQGDPGHDSLWGRPHLCKDKLCITAKVITGYDSLWLITTQPLPPRYSAVQIFSSVHSSYSASLSFSLPWIFILRQFELIFSSENFLYWLNSRMLPQTWTKWHPISWLVSPQNQ